MGVNVSQIDSGENWINIFNDIKKIPLELNYHSRIVKYISWKLLWDNFLNSNFISFAITLPELISLLENSLKDNEEIEVNNRLNNNELKGLIKEYVEFIQELNEINTSLSTNSSTNNNNNNNNNNNINNNNNNNLSSTLTSSSLIPSNNNNNNNSNNNNSNNNKYFDFLSICSSILIVSEDHLEVKIDMLFSWIDLNMDNDISFEELYLGLTSYERGLSYLRGLPPTSSKYIKAVAQQWFSLCGFGRELESTSGSLVGKVKFFEFCTNRQQAVRKLLEAFASAKIKIDKTGELQEIVTIQNNKSNNTNSNNNNNNNNNNNQLQITGGDQWLANPAWKKTAELMTPPDHNANPSRPPSSLQLEWVYGCRGFDCRNNVRYFKFGTNQHSSNINTNNRAIVFTAASLGVIQIIPSIETNIEERKQLHFGDHTDDIISISIYNSSSSPDDYTIATGEMGKTPVIHLWDQNLISLACMKGTHTKAVSQLTHSSDGKFLFSIGLEYTIALYCIDKTNKQQFGKQVCSSQGPKSKILHASSYGRGNDLYITCGEKHICFWIRKGSSLTYENASLDRGDKNKLFLSATHVGERGAVVGASDGTILYFINGTIISRITLQGNDPCVNAIWSPSLTSSNSLTSSYFLIGGKHGLIAKYNCTDNNCTLVNTWNVPEEPTIRSITMDSNENNILICTLNCKIIELNINNTSSLSSSSSSNSILSYQILNEGHFKDELWGLAVRPPPLQYIPNYSGEFASVGDDCYLRVFSVREKKQIYSLDMKVIARCCSYSPDGTMLAVGFGGRVGKGKQPNDGMFRIYRLNYNSENKSYPEGLPTMIFEARDAKQWITEVKFSADNRILAVGSKDNNIYVYSIAQRFKLKYKFSKHKSSITHFDLSIDGKYMQSTCSAYELLFSSLDDGKPILRGTSLMKVEWSTWTSPLGWPVQGIWPPTADGTDINAVDRSPSGNLIATADDFGKVKIFRYPCVIEKSEFNVYSGHSSHVTNVRWVSNSNNNTNNNDSDSDDNDNDSDELDSYLISSGGNDKCLFQWKNTTHIEDQQSLVSIRNKLLKTNEKEHQAFNEEDLEAPSGGDEFMAIKPWKGAIKAPSNFGTPDPTRVVQFHAALGNFSNQHGLLHSNNNTPQSREVYNQVSQAAEQVFDKLIDSGFSSRDLPDTDEIELSWVNGYRGFDCRNNLRYGCNGKVIIYYTANLGIVLCKENEPKQLYFRGHTDDIISMATYEDHTTTTNNNNNNNNNIEETLVVSGQRGKANTYVWTVTKNSITLNSTFQTGQKSVNMLEFSQDGRLVISIAEDYTVAITEWKNQRVIANVAGEPAPTYDICAGDMNKLFLSCGEKYIRVWSLSGRNLTSVKVSTSGKGKPQKFWSAKFFAGQWVVGCDDGSIYVIPLDSNQVTRLLSESLPSSSSSTTTTGTGTKVIKSSTNNNSKNQKTKKTTSNSNTNNTSSTTSTTTTNSAITSLSVSNSGALLIAGSKDGNISLYSVKSLLSKISIQSVFSNIQFLGLQIQSISCRENEGLIDLLIGTRGCDIIEIKRNSSDSWNFIPGEKSPLVQGHFNDELWGLAVHPFLPEYITVGDDKTLRRWLLHPIDNRVNRMISCLTLGIMSRACAYHPSGKFIAVGFGGRVGRGKQKDDGILRIYSYPDENSNDNTMLKLCEMKDAKQWISDVKFSPDGTILAVGSHDNIIFFYSINEQSNGNVTLQLTGKFSKHNSYITHLDFSADSRFIQSNCGAYELLFSDTSTKRQITSASELRDVRWSTWTCTLGWPVQGIWPTGADGTDINAVDRSHSGHLIATSDDFGKVKIFRYPCVIEGADSLVCSGHSSHVMNVRWTVGDEYLISCGGNDKSVFQWKHIIISTDTSPKGNSISRQDTQLSKDIIDDDSYNISDMGEISGGDEFMAVKPWKGAIRAPENPPPINSTIPSTNLNLHWVHGYTSGSAGSNDSRISSNLFYNLNGDIIYPAAALGICLHYNIDEPENKTQKYFQGHNDDILCLTISQCKRYVATGQTASKDSKGKGSICIWDAVECRLLSEMKGCHQRGVISLSFNPESDKLVSVGLDNNYQHILWSDIGGSWSRVQQVITEKSDQKTHLYTRWIPSIAESESNFVSGGATSIHFWKIEGSALTRKESRTGKYKQKPILCAANLRMKDRFRLISGTSSGDLYVFEHDSRECKNAIEGAHDGAILTLAEGEDYQFLISGGMDKCIKIWNQALQPITFYKFEQSPFISPVNASVASLDYRLDQRRNIIVLVGTVGGEIIEVSANTEQGSKATSLSTSLPSSSSSSSSSGGNINFDLMKSTITVILQSHYSGELWGIAPHPHNPDLILSVGDDGTIRLWNISTSLMISCLVVGKPMRSVCWNSEGNLFAVGFFETNKGTSSKSKSTSSSSSSSGSSSSSSTSKSGNTGKKSSTTSTTSSTNNSNITLGSCAIYKYNDSNNSITFISTGCSSTAWISDIKFSPHNSFLALGSHDKKLYVYDVPNNIESTEDWKNSFKKPRYTFNKHSSAILHFDFTADENFFQTNCQAYELLFGDAKTGLQKTSATELSRYNGQLNDPNEQWSTWTCTLGWPVQGIWPTGADGTDINAVDRSHQMNLIASADDFGLVKLFRYPCVEEGSKFKSYTGHSSHVTCVRWNSNDNYLVSSGGNDKCLFIWKVLS